MKRLALLGVFVLGSLLLVSTAGATRPDRFFLPSNDYVVSGVCSFDVGAQILQNNEYATVFDDGRVLITGTVKHRYTNLSDPSKSIDVNVSGPGTITPTADGGAVLEAEGHWDFAFLPGDLGPGSPAMWVYTSGLTTLAVDGSGNLTFTPSRNTMDVCAALT